MKPIKLTFSGINSFSEKTEIDFTKLTASGLFGIFGDTGSGKSTILDSINFALYGDVDRSKKKVDIINYNCDTAEVEFVFDILSDGERKQYTVERTLKKKSGLGKAMLYVGDGEAQTCIADNTTTVNAEIERIIGLNADDFRKCIALPQGEFSQFVKSPPSERFKLIERLFSLSKYGDRLKERLGEKESEINLELRGAEAELSAYADVTAEIIEDYVGKVSEYGKQLTNLAEQSKKFAAESEKINKLYESNEELKRTEEELGGLNAQKGAMESLKAHIKSVPTCKAAAECNGQLTEKLNLKCTNDGEIASKEKLLSDVNVEIKALEEAIKENDYDNILTDLQTRLAGYRAADDTIKQLHTNEKKRQVLREKYHKLSVDGVKLAEEEKAVKKLYDAAQADYEACSKADVRQFFDEDFKHSVLREEYEKQIVYFGDLREGIKFFNDDSQLYDYVRKETTDRIKHYESLILASQGEKIDIDKTVRTLQAAADKRERLADKLSDCKSKLSECSNKLLLNAKEQELVKTEGGEISARIAELNAQLEQVFGNVTDYDGAISKLKKRIEEIKTAAKTSTNRLQLIKDKAVELNISLAQLKATNAALTAEISQLNDRLGSLLKEGGFESVDDCQALLKEIGDCQDAEKRLSDYEERLIALNALQKKLSKIDGIRQVNLQQAEEKKRICAELDDAIKEKHADLKLAENKVKELTEKLEKKKLLEDKFSAIIKRKNLIAQLRDLTKGNKFMEYIAGEYLSEISAIATGTLLKLTDGRYFLSYTDTFYVGDNYNCGGLRGVNTLSGGETFLVSLSLALALSSVICAKSLKSIEFFFLDEGFGTLDENLIETVMDSLEKLKSSDFTIGIISHVAELKHRIDSKIIVNKATESYGSTVQVIS